MGEGKDRYKFAVLALIAVHLAIAIPLAYHLNIWSDEGSSLYTTHHGLYAAITGGITDEKQAPLYFGVLGLWRMINGSIFFARMLSVVFSVLAIKYFADLADELFDQRTALPITAFFALHPFLFWASLEIRAYSLVLLLSVLIVRYFFKGFSDDDDKLRKPEPRSRILFLAASIVGLYTNYYLGFVLVGLFCVLLVRRQWNQAISYLKLMLIASIACVPLAVVIRSQIAVNTAGFQGSRSSFEAVRLLWHHVLTFVLPAEIFPGQDSSIESIIRLNIVRVAALILGLAAVFHFRHISRRTIDLAVLSVVIAVFFVAAYFLLGPDYAEIRHASVLFVPLILLLASLIGDLIPNGWREARFSRPLMAAAALLVLASFSYSVYTLYPNWTKRGDWARVAEYIEANQTAGQPILVFPSYDVLSVKSYYHGPNVLLPDENYFDFTVDDTPGSETSLTHRIEFAISKIPAGTSELWLVVSDKCTTTDACVPLEKFVEANYTVVKEKDLYRERIRLLQKKTQ